jgi:hypothetical protein
LCEEPSKRLQEQRLVVHQEDADGKHGPDSMPGPPRS